MRGRPMSRIATSGFSVRTRSSAVGPSDASPTTVSDPLFAIALRTPSRKTGCPSATTMRGVSPTNRLLERKRHDDRGAQPGARAHLDVAAEHSRALANAHEARPEIGRMHPRAVERAGARTVVLHFELD